ncbi:MAG: acyl carrier protein [Clostridia bacterium]|nr:acyl carrier protein [Clostridia bacterium]
MLEKLTLLIREYKGDDSIVIDEETSLVTDLGLTSLDMVQLVLDAEDKLNIYIPDQSLKDIKTVGDIIRLRK